MRNEELEAYQKVLIEEQNKEPFNARYKLISSINKVIAASVAIIDRMNVTLAIPKLIPPINPDNPILI